MIFPPLPAEFTFDRRVEQNVAYDLNWLLNAITGGGGGGGAGMVPYHILAGETFTVPVNKQALFAETIVVDGTLVVNGHLIQVD